MPTQVIIVGAGAGGLAVGAALGQRGVWYELLERADSIGASWRSRYASLRLHTARSLSGLPGAPISRHWERWVSRDHLVGYLEGYARRFDVEPEFGVEVVRLDRDQNGWQVVTAAGTRQARSVVLATGYTRTPYLPDWPGLDTYTGDFGTPPTTRNHRRIGAGEFWSSGPATRQLRLPSSLSTWRRRWTFRSVRRRTSCGATRSEFRAS